MTTYCDRDNSGPNCARIAVVVLHSAYDGDDQPFCRPCAEGFAERCKNNTIYGHEARIMRQWLNDHPTVTPTN